MCSIQNTFPPQNGVGKDTASLKQFQQTVGAVVLLELKFLACDPDAKQQPVALLKEFKMNRFVAGSGEKQGADD